MILAVTTFYDFELQEEDEALIEQNNSHCKDMNKYQVHVQHIPFFCFGTLSPTTSALSPQNSVPPDEKASLRTGRSSSMNQTYDVRSACSAFSYSAEIELNNEITYGRVGQHRCNGLKCSPFLV